MRTNVDSERVIARYTLLSKKDIHIYERLKSVSFQSTNTEVYIN